MCILCQKRLRLSRKLDECKPLNVGNFGSGAQGRVHGLLLSGFGAGAYTRSRWSST